MTARRQGKAASDAKLEQVTAGGKRFVRRVSGKFVQRDDVRRPLAAGTGAPARATGGTPARRAGSAAAGASRLRRKPTRISYDYLALVRRFPLRPIGAERDYDAALEVLDGLVTQDEDVLTAGERDYVATLTLLVERYEDEHYRIDPAVSSPVEALKYLMDQSGMGVADLGR